MTLAELMERAGKGESVETVMADVLAAIELPDALKKKIRAEAAIGAREGVMPLLVLFWLLNRK